MSKVVSYSEFQANNTKESVWVAIHGKVYNVTTFINEHPGGYKVLMGKAGKDATSAFEKVGHSEEARSNILPLLLVGELEEGSVSTGWYDHKVLWAKIEDVFRLHRKVEESEDDVTDSDEDNTIKEGCQKFYSVALHGTEVPKYDQSAVIRLNPALFKKAWRLIFKFL